MMMMMMMMIKRDNDFLTKNESDPIKPFSLTAH